MSNSGKSWFDLYGDDANWANGIAPIGAGSGISPGPSSKVGLFGGQYATMMENVARSRLAEKLFGPPADLSGDGTGLRPSVMFASKLPRLPDPILGGPTTSKFPGTPLGLNLPASIGGQLPQAIPLSAAPSAPNDQAAHAPANSAVAADSPSENQIKVDPTFIFGEENNPTDDPTQVTLPIPNSAKADIKDSIYRHTGFTTWGGKDLGGSTSKEATIQKWKRWKVPDKDIDALTPMIGLTGAQAEAYRDHLRANRQQLPTLSPEGAEAMRQGALRDHVAAIQKAYDNSNPPVPFAQLPPGVQTAIADIAYQTPAIATGAAPKLWRQMTSDDWNGMIANLKNYYGPTAHPTKHDVQRRKDEAALVERSLKERGLINSPK